MDAETSSHYLKQYFRVTVGMLLGLVTLNAVVDPLWVYHAPWLPQVFVKDQRQGNPGIARFSKYDAVVIGNSMTENLLVSEIQTHLGWQPLKLCVSGSTPKEQRLILDQALATGQVRDVLWSIDLFSMEFGPDDVRFPDFPFHLYNRDSTTAWKYLMSGNTLFNSVKVLFRAGPDNLEARHLWHAKAKFGQDQMLPHWQTVVSDPASHRPKEDLAWLAAEKHLFELANAHPEIRFHFVFPPYSALYRVSELLMPGNGFEARMRFKRKLAHQLVQYPNVEVFDFETASDVTHDVDRYMDLVHFNLATSTSIIRWISQGDYRMTADRIDDQIRSVENETFADAQTVFATGNPLRSKLRIDELGLKLPTVMASAVPETGPSPTRVAEEKRPEKN